MVAKDDLKAVPAILNRLLVADVQEMVQVITDPGTDPVKKLIKPLAVKLQTKQTIDQNLRTISQALQASESLKPKEVDLIPIRRIATVHGAYVAVHHLLQRVTEQLKHNAPASQLVVDVVHHRFQNLPALLAKQQNEYSPLLATKIQQVMKTQSIAQLSGLEFEIDNLLKNYVHRILSEKSPNQKVALNLSWFIVASKVSHRFFRI